MRIALTLAIVALLISPRALAAGNSATDGDTAALDAKTRYKLGMDLYKQGRWLEAIEEFQTAYRNDSNSYLLFNIARCHEKLGANAQALTYYSLYLRETPNAFNKVEVQAKIAAFEKSLAERKLQVLMVFSEPAHAELRVNDRIQGTTPWNGEMTLGKYRLVLSLTGYEQAKREVELGAHSVVVDIKLKPIVIPITVVPAAAAIPANPVGAAHAETAPRKRVWTWVAAGVGAASLVAAVTCGIVANNASNDLRNSRHSQADHASLYNVASTTQTAANVLYGVGAAGLVTGGVLYFAGTF